MRRQVLFLGVVLAAVACTAPRAPARTATVSAPTPTAWAAAPQPTAPPAPAANPAAPDVEVLLGRMSLEQKVGQVMMVGFSGLRIDAPVEALVKGWEVGGVCLFRRNIASAEQVAQLNDALRALLADTVPPFIAVDQEGGNVVRIADGNIVLPGNMALAATRDDELSYAGGKAQGEDLKRLGFNMNLAPVLDVNVNPRNPVIGIRSFGDNVDLVSRLGVAFVRGQQDAQVVTVAKHFPGHGSAEQDSHRALPVLTGTEAELMRQISPFEAAMRSGLDGMMTAHIAAPALSGDDLPATLSVPLLGELLRQRLAYDGLVITDELEMDAIDRRWGVGQAAVLSLLAGADMVLVPWRAEKKEEVRAALLKAARSGELPASRLDAAVRRVLVTKIRRGLFAPSAPLAARLAQLGANREVAQTIAYQSTTLLRTRKGLLPLGAGRKVAVVTAEATLADAIRARHPDAKVLVVPAWPTDEQRAQLKRQARALAAAADVVVVGVVNSKQLELAHIAGLTGTPVVAVVQGAPYLAAQLHRAQAVLVVYSYQATASEAAASSLFGERGTPGRLPVALPHFPFGFGLDSAGGRLAGTPDGAHTAGTGAP